MQVEGFEQLKSWIWGKLKGTGLFEHHRPENQLDCSVSPAAENHQQKQKDGFVVKIKGSIRAPKDRRHTVAQIVITDVTDGISKAKPAHSSLERWQMNDSSVFCYSTELGRLPKAVTKLADWITVAKINADWLTLPRRGKRDLLLVVSILAGKSGEKIASTYCNFIYENSALGYVDLQENIEHAKILAITLAFAVAIADNDLADCELELIKSWAQTNIAAFNESNRSKRRLEKALNRTVSLLNQGRQIDIPSVCSEIVRIAVQEQRRDILKLCMYVAKATGTVTEGKFNTLSDIAERLEIDKGQFFAMTERFLPPDICQVKDIGLLVGITSDMSKDQARERLNKQYRKWSSRVTNFDPEIRQQAASMLKYIAKARSEYIE